MQQPHKSHTLTEATHALERYCTYQERCHKEARQKLWDLRMIPEAIDHVVNHLIQHDYLNETRFAEQFARSKFNQKKWGRQRITRELKRREISKYNIQLALNQMDDTNYFKTFDALAQKRFAALKNEKDKYRKRKKLADYLLYRGWESDLVYGKVRELIP